VTDFFNPAPCGYSGRKDVLYRIKQFPHNLIFFLFVTGYIWLVIEPRLIYPCFSTILSDAPVFITGWTFLQNSLALPGGFVMYLSGLLSQGYYYSWLGTVVIVLSALFLCELSRRHLVAAGYARPIVLTSFPAILLFLIYSRYKHPLPASLAVSLGLLCSLVFERLPLRRLPIRAVVYCLVTVLLFWLAGAGGLLVFVLMTIIYAIFVRRDWRLPLLTLPASLAIVWALARYVFLIPPQQAFVVLTPISAVVTTGMKTFSRVLIILLYSFVPLSVLLLFLGRKLFTRTAQTRKISSEPTKRKKTHSVAGQKRLSLTIFKKAAALAVPIVLMVVGLYFSHDPMTKPLLLAHDYSLRRQWDKILELSRTLPKGKTNVYFNHDVIRALYHTGRLPYDLFQFPLTPHALFLTHEKKVSYLTQLKLCDAYMELGQVNMAEKLASEILATKNHSALALEKLAWINIIKSAGHPAGRQNRTARIYLHALKKDLIYRRTAEALLRALDNGLPPDQAAYVDRLRSYMLEEGHPGTGRDSIEQMLTALLVHNPHNKMAFEYLMAAYLLTGQVDKIAANMERLDALGYQTTPVLYQEAVLIYFGSHGQKIDPSKFNISPQTIERYNKFVQLRNTIQPHNRQAVLQRLIVEFGSSYFFYSTFGCVGLI
jgi:hypothetical protein